VAVVNGVDGAGSGWEQEKASGGSEENRKPHSLSALHS
jgi:hypothetical protein